MHATDDVASYRQMNQAIVAVIVLAVVWSLLALWCAPWLPSGITECASRRWLARDCPLCGSTRAFIHLLSGDVAGARRLNPLAVPGSALLAIEFLYRALVGFLPGAERRLIQFRRLDGLLHVTLAAGYLLYAVWFIIR